MPAGGEQSAEVSGFVLAGGLSSRMGRDKARLELDGTPLVQLALEKLEALGCSPRIVGCRADLSSYAAVIEDLRPGCGPLGGIEAALAASTSELSVFLPVDIPLLPLTFVKWMVERASLTGAVVTIPAMSGRPHPLCSVLRRELLPGIRRALADGEFKVMDALSSALGPIDVFSVEAIAHTQWDWPVDPPPHLWFRNLNRPEDLDAMNVLRFAVAKSVAGRADRKVS